jgi:hypothetical protein
LWQGPVASSLVLGCWQQAVELGLKEGFEAWPDFASNFVRFMSTGTVYVLEPFACDINGLLKTTKQLVKDAEYGFHLHY